MQSAFQEIGVVNGELQTLHPWILGLLDSTDVSGGLKLAWKRTLGPWGHGTSQDFGVGVYHEDIQIYSDIPPNLLPISYHIFMDLAQGKLVGRSNGMVKYSRPIDLAFWVPQNPSYRSWARPVGFWGTPKLNPPFLPRRSVSVKWGHGIFGFSGYHCWYSLLFRKHSTIKVRGRTRNGPFLSKNSAVFQLLASLSGDSKQSQSAKPLLRFWVSLGSPNFSIFQFYLLASGKRRQRVGRQHGRFPKMVISQIIQN